MTTPIESRPRGPLARSQDIVVTDVDGETLVYDLRTHEAHAMDGAAAILWRLCDGDRDAPALADELHRRLASDGRALGADDGARLEATRYCLARLARAGLVDVSASDAARIGRRALLRRAAAAGLSTIAIPTVLSVLAPSSLQAQGSCVPTGMFCVRGGPRCCDTRLSCKNQPGGGGNDVCR